MIAKAVVFACAFFGLVAGSCFEIKSPQECSQALSFPIQSEASFPTPVIPDSIYSSGSSSYISGGCSSPVVADNIYSSGSSSPVYSASVVATPVVSENCYSTESSRNSIAELISSGSSSGSSYGNSVIEALSGSGSSGAYSGLQAGNGPESSPIAVFKAPAVTLPAVESPMITLSSQPIPAPRVLSQRCVCTKTIVKPQVYQRLVTVPRLQRYVQRTVSPVIENVAYKSTPITQESSSSGSGSSSASLVLSGSGSSCSPVAYSSEYGYSGYGSSKSSSIVLPGSGCGSGSYDYTSAYVTPVAVSSGSSCQRLC